MEKTKEYISECPICGEEIQSTESRWMSGLSLSLDGIEVIDSGTDIGSDDSDERRVYCANDHTQQEMIDRLKLCTREELEEQLEIAITGNSPKSVEHIESVLVGDEDPDPWLLEFIRETRANRVKG